jgi:hypothetical protein
MTRFTFGVLAYIVPTFALGFVLARDSLQELL